MTTAVALTSAPNGGWTQVIEPRAVEHNGVVYFAFIDGTAGHVKVGKWDGTTTTLTTVGTAPEVDTHDAPVILIRPDDRMLVFWSGHDGTGLFERLTTNVLPDITNWDEVGNLDSVIGGTLYTYPSAVYLGTDIYLFYRDHAGGKGRLAYSTSSNGGVNWAAQTVVATPGAASNSSYWTVASNGSRIDIAISTGNAADDVNTTVHHLYYDGAWKGADGTALGSPIFTVGDLPVVYDATDGPGWPSSIISDGPTLAYAVNVSGDVSYRRARWNGSSWDRLTVGLAGTPLTDPAPSPCLTDADTMYAPVGAVGVEQLYRWDGPGWTATAVTEPSGDIYPARIHDGTTLTVVWLRGTYTSYLDNSLRVMAGFTAAVITAGTEGTIATAIEVGHCSEIDVGLGGCSDIDVVVERGNCE